MAGSNFRIEKNAAKVWTSKRDNKILFYLHFSVTLAASYIKIFFSKKRENERFLCPCWDFAQMITGVVLFCLGQSLLYNLGNSFGPITLLIFLLFSWQIVRTSNLRRLMKSKIIQIISWSFTLGMTYNDVMQCIQPKDRIFKLYKLTFIWFVNWWFSEEIPPFT